MNINDTPDTELDFGDDLDVQQPEVAEAPAPAPAPAPAKPIPQTIPYDRFVEVNDAKKRAEEAAAAAREEMIRMQERLRLLEQSKPEPKAEPVDVKALKLELKKAKDDFDVEKEIEIQEKINAELIRQAEERMKAAARAELEAERARKAEQQAKAEEAELRSAAVEIVTKYPFLNSTIPEKDQEAIDDVLALRQRNIERGMSPAEALKKAVARFAKEFDARIGTVETPEPSKAAESKLRNAKAAAAQPPALTAGKSAGASDSALDPEKLTREQWMALPDSEREKYLA